MKKEKKILLVEDDSVTILAESKILQGLGYTIVTAMSGEKAIDIVMEDPEINIILMDIDLGDGISGPDASKKILAIRNIPIVFLTSHSESEMVEKVQKITRYGYVIKKSGNFVLQSSIEMALNLFESHQKLQESEEKYRHHFGISPDVMYIIDREFRVLYVSPNAERMLGYTPDELIGNIFTDIKILSEQSLEAAFNDTQKVFSGENVEYAIYEFMHKNGTRRIGEVTGVPYIRNNKIEAIISVARDVTERMHLKNALTMKEARFRALIEKSSDVLTILDETGTISYISPSVERVFGYTREETIGKGAFDFLHPDDREIMIHEMMQGLADGVQTKTVEYRFLHKNGTWRNVETIGTDLRNDPSVNGIVLNVRDNTEYRKTQEKLNNHYRLMNLVLEGTDQGFWTWNITSGKITFGGNWMDPPGYEQESRNLDISSFKNSIHPANKKLFPRALADYLEGRNKYYEVEYQRKVGNDAELKWFWIRGVCVSYDDEMNPLKIMGTYRDITRDKNAKQALIESEARYHSLIEASPDAIVLTDLTGKILMMNRQTERQFGFNSGAAVGMDVFSFFLPDELNNAFESMIETLQKGFVRNIEFNIAKTDGSLVPIELSASIVPDTEGEPQGFMAIMRDISERKQSEKELKKSYTLYHDLVETSQDLIWQCDNQGRYTYLNPAWEKTFGYTADEMLGKKFSDFQSPDVAARDSKEFSRIMEEGWVKGYETQHIGKSGQNIHLVFNAKRTTDETGNAAGTMGTAFDITDHRRIKEEATNNELFLNNILDSIQDGICVLKFDLSIVRANYIMEQRYGHMLPLEGKKCFQVLQNKTSPCDNCPCLRAFKTGKPETSEVPLTRNSNQIGVLELFAFPVQNHLKKPDLVVGYFRDVTAKKKTEKNIQRLLEEKEILLKEVHHRIKNNMNTIANLLVLQLESAHNDEVAAALQDAHNRVIGMMLIYDKLYRSSNYGKIDVGEYLSHLINEISSTSQGKTLIEIEKIIDTFYADSKIIFPIGIITNELVTNALKYAFPDNMKGKIRVEVRHSDEKNIEMVIQDNGIGISPSIIPGESNGFGLNLVTILTRQIEGIIQLSHNNGTEFRIVFPCH